MSTMTDQYGEPVAQKIDKALAEISNAMEDVETGKPAVAIMSFLRMAQEYMRDAKSDVDAIDAHLRREVKVPDGYQPSNEEIHAWRDRNDLIEFSLDACRAAIDDARSMNMLSAAPTSVATDGQGGEGK